MATIRGSLFTVRSLMGDALFYEERFKNLTKEEYVELSDKTTEILLLLEKADVLSDDIYISFFDRFEDNEDAFATDHEIRAARIKTDMLRKFPVPALRKTIEFYKILEAHREKQLQ